MSENKRIEDLYRARFPNTTNTSDFSMGELTNNAPNTSMSSFFGKSVTGISGSNEIEGGEIGTYTLQFVTTYGDNFELLWVEENFTWSGSGIPSTPSEDTLFEDNNIQLSETGQNGSPSTILQPPAGENPSTDFLVNESTISWEFTPRLIFDASADQAFQVSSANISGTYSLIGIDASSNETTLDSYNFSETETNTGTFDYTAQTLSFAGDPTPYSLYRIQIGNMFGSVSLESDDPEPELITDYSWVATLQGHNDTVTRTSPGTSGTDNYITGIQKVGRQVNITAGTPPSYPVEQRIYGKFADGFNTHIPFYDTLYEKTITIVEPTGGVTSYSFVVNQGADKTTACGLSTGGAYTQTIYGSQPSFQDNTTFYTDDQLTTTLNGDTEWFKHSSSTYIAQISGTGDVISMEQC